MASILSEEIHKINEVFSYLLNVTRRDLFYYPTALKADFDLAVVTLTFKILSGNRKV